MHYIPRKCCGMLVPNFAKPTRSANGERNTENP